MSNDGRILTNLWLRQEVRHVHLWEIFPGDNKLRFSRTRFPSLRFNS